MCSQRHVATILAQGGNGSDDQNTGAVVAPLYFSTAYRHPGLGESSGFDYARLQTPTRQLLEKQLATLEQGVAGFATSSGMAAIDLVFRTFLQSADHFISSDDLYGGSFRFFDTLKYGAGITYDTWDGQTDLTALIQPKTRLIWLETPSNPTMKVVDIAAVAQAVHAVRPDILVAVDNTFLTPVLQQPLALGADLVVHSATKYLGGHNDILAGAVVAGRADLAEKLTTQLTTTGQVLDPFSSWLLLRSLKTLHLRIERHQATAQTLQTALQKENGVTKVLYPGQGGMLSFYLAGGYQVDSFLRGLQVASFAESLGGVETLITVPAVQTHHDMTQAAREALGITDNLIRVSVGLEDARDLIDDIVGAIHGSISDKRA